MESMKRRDGDIAAASEAFAMKKMELREKQAALDEKARFLEQEKANNKEVGVHKPLWSASAIVDATLQGAL